MSLLNLLIGSVVVLWVFWLWSRRKFYAMMFKLPTIHGYPFVGMALKLARKEDTLDLICKYNERYPTLYSWVGPYPILLTSEPDIVRDILTSPHCVNKSILYKAVDNGTGKGLFGLKDPEWSVHRKHLNPTFSHKVLLSFIPIFNEEVNSLVKWFENKTECVDLITTLQQFTLNIAIRTTMGKSATEDAGGESNSHLLKSYQCVVENMTAMIFSPWLYNETLRKLLGIYWPYHKAKTEIRQFIKQLIKEKLNSDEDKLQLGRTKNIFIEQAIELMEKNIFTCQEVEDESNVIVIGAFETTANTIAYVLILLAMFPEYQEKAFEEIVSIFPEEGEFEVTYANTQDMVYMDMILNESMRVIAPVPIVARQNSQDVKLSNGLVLPAGLQIGINVFNMHRRKDIWGPDADIFNPDNFLPSNINEKHPYAFIPFTKGIRNCIGWRYAMISAKVALAKLLRNYRFTTNIQYKDLEYIESIVVKLKHVPPLTIHKRDSI